MLRVHRTALILGLMLLFGVAAALRLPHLDSSRMLSERQFRSALIARSYYFDANESIPDWRREIAGISRERMGVMEPPILERVVAGLYALTGGERLWISRLLSSIFWLGGGLFLFAIARHLVSTEGAVVALIYYLTVPLGVAASVSFIPDPLMILLFLASLLAIVRHHERPTTGGLVVAAVTSAVAILVKPLCLFTILGAFLSLLILRAGSWKHLLGPEIVGFLAIGLFPTACFYAWGLFVEGFLAREARVQFVPSVLLERGYWKDWLLTSARGVGSAPLVAALLGTCLLRPGTPRALLVGLGAGYVVFCLAFAHHVRFAPHYQLQLVVIVALCLGALADAILRTLRGAGLTGLWWLPAIAALCVAFYLGLRAVDAKLISYSRFESQQTAAEIGELVGHTSRAVWVAPYYGVPLEYHAEVSGTYWPKRIPNWDWVRDRSHTPAGSRALEGKGPDTRRELGIEERISALDFVPDYFVITDFERFHRYHNDLEDYLRSRWELVAETDRYLVFRAPTRETSRPGRPGSATGRPR